MSLTLAPYGPYGRYQLINDNNNNNNPMNRWNLSTADIQPWQVYSCDETGGCVIVQSV